MKTIKKDWKTNHTNRNDYSNKSEQTNIIVLRVPDKNLQVKLLVVIIGIIDKETSKNNNVDFL